MLGRILGTAIAIGLLALLAMPFGHEIYYRYEVWHQLNRIDDAGQRAAFEGWKGSAEGFQQQLRDRCIRVYGANAPACERFRAAAN